jgi:hypothetical protein
MKLLLFTLTILLLTSCTKREITLQVCATNEKLILFDDVYSIGDTVILQQTIDPIGELAFEIDNNWIIFSESYKYLGETGYYKAIVLKSE